MQQPPVKAKPPTEPVPTAAAEVSSDEAEAEDENDAELSEIDEDIEDDDEELDATDEVLPAAVLKEVATHDDEEEGAKSKRKRKRKDADEQLEDAYMSRLVREEEKDAERAALERAAKRQKQGVKDTAADAESDDDAAPPKHETEQDVDSDAILEGDEDVEDAASPPPKHETQTAGEDELSKASRTVFLGNVSTDAISSKSSRKALLTHLASFFEKLPVGKDGIKHKVESIRFRSTPYATSIPKKAAYAKKELMDATTKSTNAYAVYSTDRLAREACQRLNGTIVLDRHLRVDSVAHPAKVDNRRCVFIGNLGFVDDETNIQDANEEDGREKRKRGKEPGDVEEGLWRTFNKCGKVESVRVIRDSTTRVGKGIAYVQFEDENGVEAAILLNEKKFPPMLPRKLRVSRAKAPKKNAKPGTGRPVVRKPSAASGYQRKLTGEEASKMGRTSRLLGRAAAAKVQKTNKPFGERPGTAANSTALGERGSIKNPEDFIQKSASSRSMVFEGHRASSKSGKSGLKLGGRKGGGKARVTARSKSFKKSKKA